MMPQNREELIAAMDTGGWPVEFYPFFHHQHVFSQWHASPFTMGSHRYANAEQWMMAEKANIFGDQEVRQRILATPFPAIVKALGRTVRGFDEATWTARRAEVVFEGNMAKFRQNPDAQAVLVSTIGRVLIETNPRDLVWGIGLPAGHVDVEHPKLWPGLNLLGFTLMRVRHTLVTS